MNSKEALKRLKQETAPATYMPDFDKNKCIEIIKKDLEQLKELRKKHANLLVQTAHLEEENEKLEKENTKLKQAIKILKDNLGVETKHCVYDKDDGGVADDWFIDCAVFNETLTEEEYELLKEVLAYEKMVD